MKIALAQINPKVADFEGNLGLIFKVSERAKLLGARLVVFPEMSLCGYPPLDLLAFPGFLEENLRTLERLARLVPPGLAVAVGGIGPAPPGHEKSLVNAIFVVENGRVIYEQAKRLLPTYDVFDERRYFAPGAESRPLVLDGLRIGFAICEDLWWEVSRDLGTPYAADPVEDLSRAGVDLIVSPSASPYYLGKIKDRQAILESIAKRFGLPVAYVNQVGGNDSLIFDGNTLVTNREGRVVAQAQAFADDLVVWETSELEPAAERTADPMEELFQALVLGIRDYAHKSGFQRAHLGLSGGIDSALVAVLAVAALGAENVRGFGMPGRYSSQGSIEDARALASHLGIAFDLISIELPFEAFLTSLSGVFGGKDPDVTEENIQARIRGTYLMAYSNKFNSLLLTTGNKSELSVGYCTLYGDMAGGLGAIGDLLKTEVYALARHVNRNAEIIPWASLEKPPSAELRPGQKDQDSLPPYDELDRILRAYLVAHADEAALVLQGEDPATVRRVLKLTAAAEYKRWQAPPVLKVAPVSFGIGRRLPLVRSFFELNGAFMNVDFPGTKI